MSDDNMFNCLDLSDLMNALEYGMQGDSDKAAAVYKGFAAMNAADVADQVVYAITRPVHVQVFISRQLN